MMTHHWLKTIYKIWADRPELIIQMFGDKNQCKAVCSSGRFFDYLQKRAFHAICGGNLLVKQYIKESARYDKELHEVVARSANDPRLIAKHMNMEYDTTDATDAAPTNTIAARCLRFIVDPPHVARPARARQGWSGENRGRSWTSIRWNLPLRWSPWLASSSG